MALSFLTAKPKLLPPQRGDDGAWVYFGGAMKTYFISDDEKGYVGRYFLAHNSPHNAAGKMSITTPPFHWHVYQTEIFDLKAGVMCYLIDGEEKKARKGDVVTIPPGKKHTFWSDPESGEDLDVYITTVNGSGSGPGFTECFLHNLFGYLNSMHDQGLQPSPFQMLAFMDSADVVLADIPFGLGPWANLIFGRWIGRYLLDYEVDYKIYSDSK